MSDNKQKIMSKVFAREGDNENVGMVTMGGMIVSVSFEYIAKELDLNIKIVKEAVHEGCNTIEQIANYKMK